MQNENILKSQKSLIGSNKEDLEKDIQKNQNKKYELEEQQNTQFSLYFLIFVFALTFIMVTVLHISATGADQIIPRIVIFRPMKFFFDNYYIETDSNSKIFFMNSKDENLKQSYFSLTLGVGKQSDGEVYGLSYIIADLLVNHQYRNYSQNSEIFQSTLKENDGKIEFKVNEFTTNFFIKCNAKGFFLIVDSFFNLLSDISYIGKSKNLKKYLLMKFGSTEPNLEQVTNDLEDSVITLLNMMHNPTNLTFQNGFRSKLNENVITKIKQDIKNYYKKNYTTSLMTISAINNLDYVEVVNFLKQQLEKFPNQNKIQRPLFYNSLQYIIQPSQMSKLHLVNSHINEDLLFLNFQLPYIIDNDKSFIPMQLFLIILNIKAENSFLKKLDLTELTYNHKISIKHNDNSHCLLQIRLHLRDKAQNKIDEILVLFFEFINSLKKSLIEDNYSYIQNLSQYSTFFGLDSDIYKFQPVPLNNSQHVKFVSEKLQVYEPQDIFTTLNLGNFIKSSWVQFLNSFSLQNLSLIVLSEKVKQGDMRILSENYNQQDFDNNLTIDFNYKQSKKFQNLLQQNSFKRNKKREQIKEQHKQQALIIDDDLKKRNESQLNNIFQKTKIRFQEENKSIFSNLLKKYYAIRSIPEYQERKFFIYQLKNQYRLIFDKVIQRSQIVFTSFLPYDQQSILKYSLITACKVPGNLSYQSTGIQLKDKVKLNFKKNKKITQNIKTLDTRKIIKIALKSNSLDVENKIQLEKFLSFKRCLLREFDLDNKTIIPTNLIKDNFLRVYFKQYRNTYQSKQVLNIEILSTSIYQYLNQKLKDDKEQKQNHIHDNSAFSFLKKKKSQFLQAKVNLDLFCQYFVQYIFKNFVKEFVLGNSIDCEFYGTILTLKLETFEQQGVIFSKKILQELKNFNTHEKFDITVFNDIKYNYIAKRTQLPSELEPITEYILDKQMDYTKFNLFKEETAKQIEDMVVSVTVDDLIQIQKLLFVDLEVSLLYTGNVNAVQAVNESKHYIKYFFEENSNFQTQLIPRQNQLPLILKPQNDRTLLYRFCLGNLIKKNVYKTIFMVGTVSNKQFIALNLTVFYLQNYLKKSQKKMKNIDKFTVQIKDYYGQFGILIHFEGSQLKPHIFEYTIENLLDQFFYFIQKLNNYDLKNKAKTTYKRIIAISGTLKKVNEDILQLYRQSTLSMSEMTFVDSFKGFNKGFLLNYIKDVFYKNQKRTIFEFYKSKMTDRIKNYKVDKNFMLNTQDIELNIQQYNNCFLSDSDQDQKRL